MKTASYFGNPWLGLFFKTNEELTLVPVDTSPKLAAHIGENLKTRVLPVLIGESNLLGIYGAMNSNGIVVSNVALPEEIAVLKKAGLNVYRSRTSLNAHGNNISVNDKGGLINGYVERPEQEAIEDALGVELVPMHIGGYTTIGSLVLATNRGYLAHYQTSDEDQRKLEEILKVKGSVGSLNMGVGFVALAAIANSKGYLAGEASSAFEQGRLEEALGFL